MAGNNLPLPKFELPYELQLLLWVAMALVALLGVGLIFFLKRYITQTDKNHESITSQLADGTKEFEALGKKISSEAAKIDESATKMKQMQADFQLEINKELLEIHKATTSIKSDLAQSKAQVDTLQDNLGKLVETVGRHQESLSLGAQALVKQRKGLVDLQTEFVKLSKNIMLMRNKKP